MGQVYRHGGPLTGPSVGGYKAFIATPCYGDVSPAYASSLARACSLLTAEGIHFELEIYSGNCHVDDSRNRIVRDFLCSDCTDLIFVDADLRFEAEDLVKLVRCNRDVVAGIYPLKQYDEMYPVRHLPGLIEKDADGLIEVECVPTGFLKIKRRVLEELRKTAHKFPSKDDIGNMPMIPIIFERTFENNTRWGGDYSFCNKWRRVGGKIHIDPAFLFEHYGTTNWSGIYGAYLMKSDPVGIKNLLDKIRDGKETEQDLIEVVHAWRNIDWHVSTVLLSALILMARESDGPILECGSGLSTICMASATKQDIYVLEHDPIWAGVLRENIERLELTNVKLIFAPLKDYGDYDWYGFENQLPQMSMIFCDGPPRSTRGHRVGVEMVMDNLKPGGLVVFDDYDTAKMKKFIDTLGLSERMVNTDTRPFYIGQKEVVHA